MPFVSTKSNDANMLPFDTCDIIPVICITSFHATHFFTPRIRLILFIYRHLGVVLLFYASLPSSAVHKLQLSIHKTCGQA